MVIYPISNIHYTASEGNRFARNVSYTVSRVEQMVDTTQEDQPANSILSAAKSISSDVKVNQAEAERNGKNKILDWDGIYGRFELCWTSTTARFILLRYMKKIQHCI